MRPSRHIKMINTLLVCYELLIIYNCLQTRIYIGMYYIYLQQWLNVFPKQQILVLKTEEYSSNTANVLQQIAQFLNIGEYFLWVSGDLYELKRI